MTDKQMYRELEKFANQHTLARDVKVTMDRGHTGMEALTKEGAKYEDAILLGHIIDGAKSYLMWKRRSDGNNN